MALSLKNTSRYLERSGDTHWWEWTAYIEAETPSELDEVDFVEYRLHPSFKNPICWITDREGGFPLTRRGWGRFTLYAKVNFRDKERPSQLLRHYLEFEDRPRGLDARIG